MKPWPYPRLFAHRGGGSLAPENTLAAIRLGQSLGYTAHEIDVKLSRDGVALLLHDETLSRTTSGGAGRAADLAWDQLKGLDAGAWHSPEFRGETLASYEAAARLLQSRGTRVNVEIKPTPGFDALTGREVALATRKLWGNAAPEQVFFSSFSFEALMAAKEAAPELRRAWLVSTFTEADWDRLKRIEASALHTNFKTFHVADVARVHDAGYRLNLYTVNDAVRARSLLAAGVDGLFTDNLREFSERFPELL